MGYQPLPKWKCYIEDGVVTGELIVSAKTKQEVYKIAKKTKLYIKWIERVENTSTPPNIVNKTTVKPTMLDKMKLMLDKIF